MLSFHLPIELTSTEKQDYCLDACSAGQKSPLFRLKLSRETNCLELSINPECELSWGPASSGQEIPTAANSDAAEGATPDTSEVECETRVSRGPPLSYNLNEFNKGNCLQADILHLMSESPARFFKLMILIDNYLRPHSREGELDDSSLSLLNRWAGIFPRAVQLGHDIIFELTRAYVSAESDMGTRGFISDLAAKVYDRARDWIEDLWVGELEQFHTFTKCYDTAPVNFDEEFVQAATHARYQLQLAALECELAECMISIDDHDDYPELLINIAVWISQFDGPIEHLMAYVREVAHQFAGDAHQVQSCEVRLQLMAGMRSEISHLIRCRILKAILLKQPKWLDQIDGTMFANVLRCGAVDFHWAYASQMFLHDEEKAFSFLRAVALAGTANIIVPQMMKSLLNSYALHELLPNLDACEGFGEPSLDLDYLWRTSQSVEEIAWRFASA